MQLILKPVSDSRLTEIIVDDATFEIGRDQRHFQSLDRSVTEGMSRHHAQIFESQGYVYINDLNSSNGTAINGRRIGNEPVRLKSDDEVEFGGLRYRVEYVGGDATKLSAANEPAIDAKIVLTPPAQVIGLDPIVVSAFPFLISRSSEVFSRYEQSAPDAFSLLSRNHAKIFIRQDAV